MRLTRENFRITSGGQTGVDRAALDVAIALGIPHGGWCPKGRLAEDGRIPDQYNLQETTSTAYMVRTIRNVRDSHGTLALTWGGASGGTFRTILACEDQEKPWHKIELPEILDERGFRENFHVFLNWLEAKVAPTVSEGHPLVLNIAGPRASKNPTIYAQARWFLDGTMERLGFYPERGK